MRNWETGMTKDHVLLRACGFKSRSGYYAVMPQWLLGRSRKLVIRASGLGVRISLTALINIGRYAKSKSGQSVKLLPPGAAGSNPALPTICRSPSTGGGAVWKADGRVIPVCRFESCLRRYHTWRRVLIGRQPVPNTGDPKGFESSKSSFHYGPR